jgi:hypothetical protein
MTRENGIHRIIATQRKIAILYSALQQQETDTKLWD